MQDGAGVVDGGVGAHGVEDGEGVGEEVVRELSPRSMRHSYVTHLTEDGVDRRFLQEQVGHRCDTSTAIYTHVSGDFMNTALRKALGPALDAPGT